MIKKEMFFLMISVFLIVSCVNSETKNYSKSDDSTSNFQTIIHEGVNREYVYMSLIHMMVLFPSLLF